MGAELFTTGWSISNYERNLTSPPADFMERLKEWALRARIGSLPMPSEPIEPTFIPDEPKRPGQMFVYPKEMQLKKCVQPSFAESHQQPAVCAGAALKEDTNYSTPNGTRLRFSETTPSVGDMSSLLRTPTFSGSLKKMITWLDAV